MECSFEFFDGDIGISRDANSMCNLASSLRRPSIPFGSSSNVLVAELFTELLPLFIML
tara:strand:- start:211 stop:384 length:174 start_codon:yes stop_codon:yes gene_type:complete